MKHILFCIALCMTITINAQEDKGYSYDNLSLIEVIKDIQERYNLAFSFADDLVQNKRISLNKESISLDGLLDLLKSQTGLDFQRISKTQVIVVPQINNTKICGYILDANTRKPIPFAKINVSSSEEVQTNLNGYFSFDSNGNELHIVSIDGYEEKAFSHEKHCPEIYLTPSNETLEEVIVMGYITTGIDRNKDGSLKVTSKTLGVLPGLVAPDMLQSIQLIPGISSLDESATGIQVRGGSPDQNLILFDGIKLYSSGYFYGMFSAINPYASQKAIIFKSGTSPAYGDRISGIIDISSGEKIPAKTIGGFGMDGLSIDGYVKTPLSNKIALYLFARRSYADAYKSPTYDSYAEKIFRNTGPIKDVNGTPLTVENDDEYTIDTSTNGFTFYDINSKVIFKPSDKNRFVLSSLFTRNDLDFSFTSDGETKVDELTTKNSGMSLVWKHKSNAHRTEKISSYFSKYNSFYNNDEFEAGSLEEINTRTNLISDFGLNIETHNDFKENQSYTFGYQISNTNLKVNIFKDEFSDPDGNFNIKQDESNLKNVFYGQYAYKTKTSGIFSVGMRLVHYNSVDKFLIEPRLNAELEINEQFRIKGSIERRHQPISQLVEFNQTELRIENNLWRLSDNTTYPLLKSDQFSTGILYDDNGWTLDLDAYYKKLSGLTSFTSGFSNPQLELAEGKSKIKGVDILLKKRMNNYRVWVGYTYNDIDFEFPNIQTEGFPGNNDIKHSFRISNSIKLANLKLSLGWQYRSGEPFTPISSFDSASKVVSFGKINSNRLENYHRLDASAIYDFKIGNKEGWKAQFGLSALNIYNRKTPISITYRTEQEAIGLQLEQVIQRFSLGFTPNASFRLFF